MIITDIKQMRDVPVGEIATLIMRFKVVEDNNMFENPCDTCVLDESFCSWCSKDDRPDKKSVKFLKI